MIYVKSALSGLLAVALCGLVAYAVFAQETMSVSFDSYDILLFGVVPVLIAFSAGFWWMFRRELRRFSK
jgi:hypothetical protein